jgi:hypothetical protein
MATSEENKELIETIKRPIRHYRILLWGYGGENSYIRLTKEQYDYWNQRKEDDDERDILVDYMLDSEKGTFFEGILTTVGKIDLSKLEVYTTDHFNDDDTVDDIRYDGESIENMGGDTNGKGYSVYMWSNKG